MAHRVSDPYQQVVLEHVQALGRLAANANPEALSLLTRTWEASWQRQSVAKHGWKLVNGPVSALVQYFLDLQVEAQILPLAHFPLLGSRSWSSPGLLSMQYPGSLSEGQCGRVNSVTCSKQILLEAVSKRAGVPCHAVRVWPDGPFLKPGVPVATQLGRHYLAEASAHP